jgi:inner membrane protein
MYLPGHVGLALVSAAVLVVTTGGARRAGVGVAVLVLLASAPDIDLFLAGIQHRGITHTVWAALVLGSTLAVGGGYLARRWGTTDDTSLTFAVGTVSVLTHLVGDVLTPMGIRPLYPLVSTTYSLDLVAARNPDANLALLCAGVCAFAAALTVERASWVPPLRTRLAARSGRGTRPPKPDPEFTPAVDDPTAE